MINVNEMAKLAREHIAALVTKEYPHAPLSTKMLAEALFETAVINLVATLPNQPINDSREYHTFDNQDLMARSGALDVLAPYNKYESFHAEKMDAMTQFLTWVDAEIPPQTHSETLDTLQGLIKKGKMKITPEGYVSGSGLTVADLEKVDLKAEEEN